MPAHHLHALYALAVATGMRQGELLALRGSDVDLGAGTVAVRQTLQRRTRELAEPKTERARRTLRLGTSAVTILRDHQTRQRLQVGRGWTKEGFVFTSRKGTALDARNVPKTSRRPSNGWGSPTSASTTSATPTRR